MNSPQPSSAYIFHYIFIFFDTIYEENTYLILFNLAAGSGQPIYNAAAPAPGFNTSGSGRLSTNNLAILVF